MSRVLLGKCEPGNRFIAQVIGVLGFEWISQIFAVVPVGAKSDGKVA